MGVGGIYGCGCKEVYRFPHTTYPYSSSGFHLENWTRGGKIIVMKKMGGRRSARDSAPARGVWGHAPPENF